MVDEPVQIWGQEARLWECPKGHLIIRLPDGRQLTEDVEIFKAIEHYDEIVATQDGDEWWKAVEYARLKLISKANKTWKDPLQEKVEILLDSVETLGERLAEVPKILKVDRDYKNALLDWEMHKHDCTMCGTLGTPGCDPGEMLWTILHETALAREEL